MAYINWTQDYDLGIEEIDRQHRRLIEIVNRLHDALEQNCPKGAMQGVVYDLVSYTEIHFAAEERMMLRLDYPGRESHRSEHAELTSELKRVEVALGAGRLAVSPELLSFLKDWMLEHLTHADRAFAEHDSLRRGVGALALALCR